MTARRSRQLPADVAALLEAIRDYLDPVHDEGLRWRAADITNSLGALLDVVGIDADYPTLEANWPKVMARVTQRLQAKAQEAAWATYAGNIQAAPQDGAFRQVAREIGGQR